jgi:beta-galactosidase/beta-glucuronidase
MRGATACSAKLLAALAMAALLLAGTAMPNALAQHAPEGGPHLSRSRRGSHVTTVKRADGSYAYLVNGREELFIGMGYDPIYRYFSDEQREASYRRDFAILRDAGVNTITGWDADKGYEQDKFDEITLDTAYEYGIGVVMPLNLPPEGDYEDPAFVASLMEEGRAKVARFKEHPALRMWGVGNEVFWEMDPEMYPAFQAAYVKIADMFHQLDPDHPVIYRESEDRYVPQFIEMLEGTGDPRPWLLYGMNVYSQDIRPLLERWPNYGLDRPVLVSEFGAEGDTPEERAEGYLDMWRAIREFPEYVIGGAPYVWTTEGPEPTDKIWGLMDSESRPVDGTFELLSRAWRKEPRANRPS